MFYLTPFAAIQPSNLKSLLQGHGNHFIGNANFEKDFYPPRRTDCVLYTKAYLGPWKKPKKEDVYPVVLFGEVATGALEADTDTSFEIRCPDWSAHGWDAAEFEDLFKQQRDPLEDAIMNDFHEDFEAVQFPKVRQWTNGENIIVDIVKPPYFSMLKYCDEDGKFWERTANKKSADFPFRIGDTVIIGGEMRRTQVYYDRANQYRNYHIFADEVRQVKIRPKPVSEFLDADFEIQEEGDEDDSDETLTDPPSDS
ncbi:hypothetical protein R3P38DRAFT_3216047 [Favolaschia claudopus]|uniref:Uncharacterized protein n=1 Tax=Favolaschia claudopus TaxID=2862362 RepID=A0AAW0A6F6_9AGAR